MAADPSVVWHWSGASKLINISDAFYRLRAIRRRLLPDIRADLIDPGRVNIFERWESQAAVETFRSSGPSNEQGAAMLSASVAEYDIADVRPYSGKAQHEPAQHRPCHDR